LAAGDSKLAYRKLNVVEWESPLSQRYLTNVPTLPYLVVYDTHGKKFTVLHGADLRALDQALTEAARR
jgi:hypothetical protein